MSLIKESTADEDDRIFYERLLGTDIAVLLAKISDAALESEVDNNPEQDQDLMQENLEFFINSLIDIPEVRELLEEKLKRRIEQDIKDDAEITSLFA